MEGAPRRLALALASLPALVACGGEAPGTPPGTPGPPNVVLLVIDTLRADHLSGYGYARETSPTLDRFIEGGARFDAAIAPSSWSPPSHVTILTGVNPYRHGVLVFGQTIAEDVEPLTMHLKRAGYATGMFSSHLALHRSVRRMSRGLDERVVKKRADPEHLASAVEWAKTVERPYFLYLVLTAPHAPYTKYPASYDERYFLDTPPDGDRAFPFTEEEWVGEGGIPTSVRLGDENRLGYYVNRYDRSIRYVDDLIGEFWTAMEEAGLLENTLLVVTSDHGEGLGDHDAFAHELYLYDYVVRVPLIVFHPGVVPAGRRWSRQAPLADIVPTVLGFAGVPVPDGLDGVDLSDALIQGDEPSEGRLVTASYRHRGFDRYMVRSEAHKLLYDALEDRYELYDLAADPGELDDLLERDGAALPDEIEELRAAMLALLARHRSLETELPAPLSPEVLDELRALGYVGDE